MQREEEKTASEMERTKRERKRVEAAHTDQQCSVRDCRGNEASKTAGGRSHSTLQATQQQQQQRSLLRHHTHRERGAREHAHFPFCPPRPVARDSSSTVCVCLCVLVCVHCTQHGSSPKGAPTHISRQRRHTQGQRTAWTSGTDASLGKISLAHSCFLFFLVKSSSTLFQQGVCIRCFLSPHSNTHERLPYNYISIDIYICV